MNVSETNEMNPNPPNSTPSASERERYLELLNEMTRSVLLSKDFDRTLGTLAGYLAKLLHADDCYIARWDEERQKAIPIANTTNIGSLYYSYKDADSQELKLTASVLSAGHALAADDVYDSPCHTQTNPVEQIHTPLILCLRVILSPFGLLLFPFLRMSAILFLSFRLAFRLIEIRL